MTLIIPKIQVPASAYIRGCQACNTHYARLQAGMQSDGKETLSNLADQQLYNAGWNYTERSIKPRLCLVG